MNIELRRVHKKLKKKWFKIDNDRDHYYCRFYKNGEIITDIRSKVGGYSKRKYKTLDDDLISQISKTLHFDDKKQFVGFLDCDPTKEQYQKMLFEKEKIRDCN